MDSKQLPVGVLQWGTQFGWINGHGLIGNSKEGLWEEVQGTNVMTKDDIWNIIWVNRGLHVHIVQHFLTTYL